MISLLNVEGRIFFSIVPQRLASYQKRISYLILWYRYDTGMVQVGIPGSAGRSTTGKKKKNEGGHSKSYGAIPKFHNQIQYYRF